MLDSDTVSEILSMGQGRVLQPIGRVLGSTIEIHKRWAKGLEGIQGFSHIIVVFWLHQARRPELRIHPKGFKELPKLGFLATREREMKGDRKER